MEYHAGWVPGGTLVQERSGGRFDSASSLRQAWVVAVADVVTRAADATDDEAKVATSWSEPASRRASTRLL